jgi:tetratricopeptide (TPR) repeat protein
MTTHPRGIVPSEDRTRIEDLYNSGLYLQAYRAASAFGDLRHWRGAAARVLAGRLAGNLGGRRLAGVLFYLAWREHPDHPQAQYFGLSELMQRRGPLATWEHLRDADDAENLSDKERALFLEVRARVLARLRDFSNARECLDQAQALAPRDPWLYVVRADIQEQEDRDEEALAAVEKALDITPWFRPAVAYRAHQLHRRQRDEEAIELLENASERLESGYVLVQLADIQLELQRYDEARRSLEQSIALLPLHASDRDRGKWLALRRCRAAYLCGERNAAAAHVATFADEFLRELAARLQDDKAETRRVQLDVGFVRQHHSTCAPATLTAIAHFWHKAAEHVEVAEAICYDGTPWHSERDWAERQGFVVDHFTVTWESARALLDRGLPFTLVLTAPGYGHLVAVIGYDASLGALLIRDPSDRFLVELGIKELLTRHRSTGPLGMLSVPQEEASKLDGIELPDAPAYAHSYRVQRALARHDRKDAVSLCQEMAGRWPDLPITLSAQRAVATYDDDRVEASKLVSQQLERFPEDQNLILSKISFLEQLGRREQRLVLLRQACAHLKEAALLQQRLAQELLSDARTHKQAGLLLRWSISARPDWPPSYLELANMLWLRGERERALEIYRFAACLDDKSEVLSQAYFDAARFLGRTDEALAFLQGRFNAYGAKSSLPARTLYIALDKLNRDLEARDVLEQALERRPEDGELLLFAAERFAFTGSLERGHELLAKADGRTSRTSWLRSCAEFAEFEADLHRSLELWEQVLEAEPMAMDAHEAVTRLAAAVRGRQRSVEHLRTACERFPHYSPLHVLLLRWLQDEADEVRESAVQAAVELNPEDAYLRREWAHVLGRLGRTDDAFVQLRIAEQLEPRHIGLHNIRATVKYRAGDLEGAREDLRAAIRLDVDNQYAIEALLEYCDTGEQKRNALEFVHEELRRQVITGDGLLEYRRWATNHLEGATLLETLREAHAARPDLWHTWSLLVTQLADMDRMDEAHVLARQSTDRFPLLPRIWLSLAHVCRLQQNRAGERDALETALRINPAWVPAVQMLADAHERDGDCEASRALLEAAIQRNPLSSSLHGYLAHAQWQLNERERALETLQRAVDLDPTYGWGWYTLREWCEEMGQPEVAVDAARRLTRNRGGEAGSWLYLAQLSHDVDEALDAAERVLALDPRSIDAHLERARRFVAAGRLDEALVACRPEVFRDQRPSFLIGEEASLEAKRGDFARAISLMEKAVEEDPQYLFGWSMLSDWYLETLDTSGAVKAATKLTELDPHSAISWGYRAEARSRNDDRAGAKEDFSRAVQLDPSYLFGGFNLFELQVEDLELEEAQNTLQAIAPHSDEQYACALRIQLACARRDWPQARQAIKELCASQGEEQWPFLRSVELIRGTNPRLFGTWDLRMLKVDANPLAALARVTQCCEAQQFQEGLNLVSRLDPAGVAWRDAMTTLLRALGEARKLRQAKRLVGAHREALGRHTLTWGIVGYVLASTGNRPATVQWLADYRSRENVEPWMVINLSLSLHELGKRREAREASQYVLELAEHAQLDPQVAVFIALDQALGGNPDYAVERVLTLEPESLPPLCQGILVYLRALTRVQRAAPEERQKAFREARDELARPEYERPWTTPGMRQTYRAVLQRLAEDVGGFRARAWAWLTWTRTLWTHPPPKLLLFQIVIAAVAIAAVLRSCA